MLADFGMATLASAAGYGGARGGTVGYMPPEQIQGMLVDERTDVFSLAVVVWQALTGQCPFAAESAASSLKKIEHGPARPLQKDCPGLSGEPELALSSAVSAYPADRPADVRDLADELLPFLGDPHDGAESLRELVEQAEKDDGSLDATRVDDLPPLLFRMPWLPGVVVRCTTALAVFAAARLVLPALPGASGQLVSVASLAFAAASALWPPLGSALVGLSVVAALGLAGPTPASFPLALFSAVALCAWWLLVGRAGRLTSLAVLLPCCLPSPVTGAAVAGYAPAPAARRGNGGRGLCAWHPLPRGRLAGLCRHLRGGGPRRARLGSTPLGGGSGLRGMRARELRRLLPGHGGLWHRGSDARPRMPPGVRGSRS